MKSIGNAEFVCVQEFIDWANTDEGQNWADNQWSAQLNRTLANDWDEDHINFSSYQKMIPNLYHSLENWKNNKCESVQRTTQYLERYSQKYQVAYYDPRFTVIFTGNRMYTIPTRFLQVTLYQDMNTMTLADLQDMTGLQVIGIPENSIENVNRKISDNKEKLENTEKEIRLLEEEKKAEFERIKKEIEERYKEKAAVLEAKKEELEELKRNLENQLFQLDTEIYAIRCYMGETIQFHPLLSGHTAAVNTPLVIYQKIRYLDEETAKWLSVYDFDGSDIKYLEDILIYRQDFREMLCPSLKSIIFLQVSRDKVQYSPHPMVANALASYKTYHGNQIAVLIRNGENYYIGWTEEERIHISEENIFYKNRIIEEAISEEIIGKQSSKEDVCSRFFIYHLLQGILDHKKILEFPEKISLSRPGPYLVFSYADGSLEDNRFGTFADIVERTNHQPLQKGDKVLTCIRVTRDDYYQGGYLHGRNTRYEKWNNDRGRGYKNRTHDAVIHEKSIETINLIDTTDVYEITLERYKCNVIKEKTGEHSYALKAERTGEKIKNVKKEWLVTNHNLHIMGEPVSTKNLDLEAMIELYKLQHPAEHNYIDGINETGYYEVPIDIQLKVTEQECYISAEKDENWKTGKAARANLQIFHDEYLNLTYLNSVWIRYAILNQKVGGWRVGGHSIGYAQSLPYLNIALEFLKKREETEAAFLTKYMDLYEDWQVDLSNWKMKHQYHSLTDTRAKAFAKSFRSERD